MDTPITMSTSQTFKITGTTQVDSSGNPLPVPNPNYGAPVRTVSDDSMITISSAESEVTPTGKTGTVVITETSTSSVETDPVLVGTITLTLTGPVAASLQVQATTPA
jgi:hypothetical protein